MINAKFWQPYYQKWLNKRIPKTNKIKLSHRSVFIVPNAAGGLYILLLVLMLITSINYQNNLLFGLTFWLFSLSRSEEHTSELQSRPHLVCRLLLEKKKKDTYDHYNYRTRS